MFYYVIYRLKKIGDTFEKYSKIRKKNKFKLETLDFEMGSIVIYFLFMDDTVSIRTNLLEIYLKNLKKNNFTVYRILTINLNVVQDCRKT